MRAAKRTFRRNLGVVGLGVVVMVNIVAAFHAWKFTHFAPAGVRYRRPEQLGLGQKLKLALTGIDNPKPHSSLMPTRPYHTVTIQSNVRLDAWYLKTTLRPKGTVLLFHGYGGEKSSMLEKAYLLLDNGYNVLLPDFMGSGGSEGDQTTIGFFEGANVRDCMQFIASVYGEQHIVLFGTSMGAAAILKYLHDGNRQPDGIILECPFGTMYHTVCKRFEMMHAPAFPMAPLLVFWGGLENGFWAFGHNPEHYAKSVRCPSLLIFGEQDDRVDRSEIDAIFDHLPAPKTLRTYPLAGHVNYLEHYKQAWTQDVGQFLTSLSFNR